MIIKDYGKSLSRCFLLLFCCLCFVFLNQSYAASIDQNRILYLMQSGQTDAALTLYKNCYEQTRQHDLDTIQQVGLLLLDQGLRTDDLESQILSIFGAGISMNEKVLYLLGNGLKNPHPQIQLASLNLLAHFHNDIADQLINKAMTSNFLLIRLEGAYQLAARKASTALGQTEALMSKVDPQLLPLFPQILAIIGSKEAIKTMRKMLAHKDEEVRIATILSAAAQKRDDLLPAIRILSTHHSAPQQEASALALAKLQDSSAMERLEQIAQKGAPSAQLASFIAAYQLGKESARGPIESFAQRGNLFAIYALGEVAGSEPLLRQLMTHSNLQIRTNAGIALLRKLDGACLPVLREILIQDSRDLALFPILGPGKGLSAFKVIPSTEQQADQEMIKEISLMLKEELLIEALRLPEKDFIELAQAIFYAQQNDLIPTLVDCLETIHSPIAIALLKKQLHQVGAPLIRNYCNLALYRLKEEGNYSEVLHTWLLQQQQVDLINFRPMIPRSIDNVGHYELTPKETSALLMESYEALAQNQDDIAISILLHAIQYGNSKNKYALAGLLIRIAQ